jgi:hypothetical protein
VPPCSPRRLRALAIVGVVALIMLAVLLLAAVERLVI